MNASASQPPHILLITLDELRKDALSCYGGDAIKTPAMDSLAQTGYRFDRAYCNSPCCLPSRCSIITGQFPHVNQAYSNFRPSTLSAETPNLYNILQGAGYTTGHIGKCHYTPAPYGKASKTETLELDNMKSFYESLGIDRLVLQNGKNDSIRFWNDYSRELDQAGYLDTYRALNYDPDTAMVYPWPGPDAWHPDAWVGRKACEHIESLTSTQPSFTWVSFSGPHYPFDAPESYYPRVNENSLDAVVFSEEDMTPDKIQHVAYHGGKGRTAEGRNHASDRACKNYSPDYWRQMRRAYFANIAQIDDWIGRIVNMAETQLGSELMVILTADHGEMAGNHGLWGKNNCGYEDVLNVPLLVRFPGEKEAKRSDAKVMLVDLLPTVCATAGVSLSHAMNGIDLREHVGTDGYPYVIAEAEQFYAISDGRYKLVRAQPDQKAIEEFYDLQTDPHEFNNRIQDKAMSPHIIRLQSALLDTFVHSVLK